MNQMSTGDQSEYLRKKMAERRMDFERGAKFMRDGFQGWAENERPVRVGGVAKEALKTASLDAGKDILDRVKTLGENMFAQFYTGSGKHIPGKHEEESESDEEGHGGAAMATNVMEMGRGRLGEHGADLMKMEALGKGKLECVHHEQGDGTIVKKGKARYTNTGATVERGDFSHVKDSGPTVGRGRTAQGSKSQVAHGTKDTGKGVKSRTALPTEARRFNMTLHTDEPLQPIMKVNADLGTEGLMTAAGRKRKGKKKGGYTPLIDPLKRGAEETSRLVGDTFGKMSMTGKFSGATEALARAKAAAAAAEAQKQGKGFYDSYMDFANKAAKGIISATGGGKKTNARAAIVKKVMKEKGLSLIEASKYVKAHGLYKA